MKHLILTLFFSVVLIITLNDLSKDFDELDKVVKEQLKQDSIRHLKNKQ